MQKLTTARLVKAHLALGISRGRTEWFLQS